MRIIDISMEIRPDMAVFPGDPAPSFERHATLAEDGYNVTFMCLSSHAGTHVDAEQHVSTQGRSAADLPLDSLYGPCQVLDLTGAGRAIRAEHLRGQGILFGSIVLLRTQGSLLQDRRFSEDYPHLTEDGAQYLVDKGLRTVGIDTLSIEGPDDDGRVHGLLVRHMTVFEGLRLADARAGQYTFCGLPLKVRLDGAPARAILIEP